MIKNTFKETYFYAPAYFAFAKLANSKTKPDKLKTPRPAAEPIRAPTRTKRPTELNELGVEVGEPAMIDELEREIAWVKRKLGEYLFHRLARV